MNSKPDTDHSYTKLLITILAFSMLASIIFGGYSILRTEFSSALEPYLILMIICIPISFIAQKFSKIVGIDIIVFCVSFFSGTIFYELVVTSTIFIHQIWKLIVFGLSGIYLGILSIALIRRINIIIKTKKTDMKFLGFIIVFSVSASIILYLIINNLSQIISILDSHPWAVTLFGIFVSLIVGVYFGRKSRK